MADALGPLIEADEVTLALPVRLELWTGVARQDRRAFLRTYGALPQLHPTEDTWRVLPAWIEKAKDVISPDVWHVCVRPIRQEYQILDHMYHISKSLPT